MDLIKKTWSNTPKCQYGFVVFLFVFLLITIRQTLLKEWIYSIVIVCVYFDSMCIKKKHLMFTLVNLVELSGFLISVLCSMYTYSAEY